MPKYEYMQMTYMHHRAMEGLDRLNELGGEGWAPAFCIGRTLILCREYWETADGGPDLGEATIDDWREIYPDVSAHCDVELRDITADDVADVMSDLGYDLPTRSTLHRWAEEARESVE